MAQSIVRLAQAFGIPGELYADGPVVAAPYVLSSADAAYNIIGATVFTLSGEGVAQAGGTGEILGILTGAKQHASYGTSSGGPLAPTMTLPNNSVAEITKFAPAGLIATLPDTAAIGDLVIYNTTSGALATVAAKASFTAAQDANTLTVTAITAGNLGVGSVINTGAAVARIVALGTGTGGDGTYTVDVSQTVASAAMTATSVPAAGYARLPDAIVDRFVVDAAGLGVIALN